MRLRRWRFKRAAWVCEPYRKLDDGGNGGRDALVDDLSLLLVIENRIFENEL